jgi:L-lactate dehydrogenase (cytochrome)
MSDETTETTILGFPSSIPVMISPAAMAKLGHPLGEVNLTKGAGSQGIIQIVSNSSLRASSAGMASSESKR